MPELPEVEITARRLDAGLNGAEIESALAPGLVALKTFDPPLDGLAGEEIAGVRRIGKMLAVEAGGLTLLVHLMSAGRLQLFDARASLRDRSSRILIRVADGRELRLREFGTQQRAWAKLLRREEVAADEAVATLGPDAFPAPTPDEFSPRIDQPRHLHPLLRDQRTVAAMRPRRRARGSKRHWHHSVGRASLPWCAPRTPHRSAWSRNSEWCARGRASPTAPSTSSTQRRHPPSHAPRSPRQRILDERLPRRRPVARRTPRSRTAPGSGPVRRSRSPWRAEA